MTSPQAQNAAKEQTARELSTLRAELDSLDAYATERERVGAPVPAALRGCIDDIRREIDARSEGLPS